MLRSLALSLLLTLLFELSLAALFGLRKRKDFLLVFLVNVVTNPPLVLTMNLLALHRPMRELNLLILPLECLVVCTEWLLYRRRLEYTPMKPFVLSLLLNTISYLGGVILF